MQRLGAAFLAGPPARRASARRDDQARPRRPGHRARGATRDQSRPLPLDPARSSAQITPVPHGPPPRSSGGPRPPLPRSRARPPPGEPGRRARHDADRRRPARAGARSGRGEPDPDRGPDPRRPPRARRRGRGRSGGVHDPQRLRDGSAGHADARRRAAVPDARVVSRASSTASSAAASSRVRGRHTYGTFVLAEPDGSAHLHDKDIPTAWEQYFYRRR